MDKKSNVSWNRRRRAAQWVTTALYNLNLPGFVRGGLYRGKLKGVCVPGLNCYSCPGAMGACPLGSLQSTLSQVKSGALLYVLGTLLILGAALGRFVCGWLCPMGLLQDCVHAVPTPKLKRKSFGLLKYLRYAVLAVFVLAVPLITYFAKGVGVPLFCKVICPAGTLAGAALRIAPGGSVLPIGPMFIWKSALLIALLLLSLFLYRPYCRFLCPLGAIYGLFNRVALVRMDCDGASCVACGRCQAVCPLGVDPVRDCNSAECIRCGKCVDACPTGAVRFCLSVKARPTAATPAGKQRAGR